MARLLLDKTDSPNCPISGYSPSRRAVPVGKLPAFAPPDVSGSGRETMLGGEVENSPGRYSRVQTEILGRSELDIRCHLPFAGP